MEPKFQDWPEPKSVDEAIRSPREIIQMYQDGFAAVKRKNEAVEEEFQRTSAFPTFSDAAHQRGFADRGKGQLILSYRSTTRHEPHAFPAPAQQTGCCVGRALANACTTLMFNEIEDGELDEDGEYEGYAPVPDASQGIISHEVLYGLRGFAGEGWWCEAAAMAVKDRSGVVLRGKYGNHDLTFYDDRKAHLWGSTGVPQELTSLGKQHPVRAYTKAKTPEEVRDALKYRFGVFFCAGLAWSFDRDANGFADITNGGWAHAQTIIGYDDREITIQRYREPLALILNSWGRRWQKGGRKVLGTNLQIPHGSYWTPARHIHKMNVIVLSNFNGFEVPDRPGNFLDDVFDYTR